MKLKKQKKNKDSILPKGYYKINEEGQIRLHMGPYNGVLFKFTGTIKIRKDLLTDTPQLIYDYVILDYAGIDRGIVESSRSLCRIIAAIAVEELSKYDGEFESVQCPIELKQSSSET